MTLSRDAGFEPLSRPSTPELIAERLREAITRGRLAPGQQLGEASLATQFEVSRGSLREAMQRLVAEDCCAANATGDLRRRTDRRRRARCLSGTQNH